MALRAALLYAAAAAACAAASPLESITADNMGLLTNGDGWLVVFAAPWCAHCKRLVPTLAQLAETGAVRVAKVDADEQRALARRWNVAGYPTLYFVKGSAVWPYAGSRTLDDLKAFVSGGYENAAPVPFLRSPYGPMGTAKGVFISAGAAVLRWYNAALAQGYSQPVAVGLLSVGLIVGGVLAILVLAWATSPSPRAAAHHHHE